MDTAFQLDVCLPDGRTLPVHVTRKRVRNLNLRVRADGSVALSIPLGASTKAAQDFLDRRGTWIAERMGRRARATEAALVPTSGPDAGTLPLWGELVDAAGALGLAAPPSPPSSAPRTATFRDFLDRRPAGERPRLDGEADAAPDGAPKGPEALPADELHQRIDALYRAEVARVLPETAARLEARMGVAATRWSIRTMTSRWGSCTPRTGAIRINAALAAYPSVCLEYVVAHELTHLMEPSHNRRFHTLLDVWCPGSRAAAALLKRPAREVASDAAGR